MARGFTLRIVIEQTPAGVDFALQQSCGSAYEPVKSNS
jgi:hypothetical protein